MRQRDRCLVFRGVCRLFSLPLRLTSFTYFPLNSLEASPPPPMSTHIIHAALTRSTGPSLGTIVFSALLLTMIRLLTLITLFLQRLPLYIPARAFFLVTGIRMAVGYLETVTTALSKYALVYSGLTGDPFMNSARRARALTSGIEAKAGKAGRRGLGAERKYVHLCLFFRLLMNILLYYSTIDLVDGCAAHINLSVCAHHVSVRRTYPEHTRTGFRRSCARGSCHSSGWTILYWSSEGYVSLLLSISTVNMSIDT